MNTKHAGEPRSTLSHTPPSPNPQRLALSAHDFLAAEFPQPSLAERTRPLYGIWTLADGREVLFDRDYNPLYSRRPGKAAEIAAPQRPKGIVKERFLWTERDSINSLCPATRKRLQRVLADWGIAL